jgi:hypothetical protein
VQVFALLAAQVPSQRVAMLSAQNSLSSSK